VLNLPASAAQAGAAEWRILGPASSWHADKTGARVEAPASVQTICEIVPSSRPDLLRTISCQDKITSQNASWS